MSKQNLHRTPNATAVAVAVAKHRQLASEPSSTEESVSEQPNLTSEPASELSSTEEPVSEQPSSTSDNQNLENDFKGFIAGTNTEDKLLYFKKAIDDQLLKIAEQVVNELVSSYKKLSPERQKLFLEKIGCFPKNPGKKATSTGDKKSREKNPYHGYEDINIRGVDYKVALRINTEANDFWNTGNPKSKTWMKDLDPKQRREKFGGFEQLEKNPELLEEFARIPGAVLVKEAGDTYKNYDGKPADVGQPTTAENAE